MAGAKRSVRTGPRMAVVSNSTNTTFSISTFGGDNRDAPGPEWLGDAVEEIARVDQEPGGNEERARG